MFVQIPLQITEKEKEEDIYEALEEVMICTQENKDLVVFSAGQNTADELAVRTDEVLSSSMFSTAQEETSKIVMLVIENLFEVMYKQIYTYQCNNSETTSGENCLFLFQVNAYQQVCLQRQVH